MCKSANQHGKRLSEHRSKWPVSWNSGKVFYLGDKIRAKGEQLTVL